LRLGAGCVKIEESCGSGGIALKKIWVLLLVGLVGLGVGGCGAGDLPEVTEAVPVPDIVTVEPTIEIPVKIETTEPPLTEAVVKILSGRGTIRKIDLLLPENRSHWDWLVEHRRGGNDNNRYLLSGNNFIIAKEAPYDTGYGWLNGNHELYLYNQKTEKETLLIKGNAEYGETIRNPLFWGKVDDTKFVYVVGGWEWTCNCGVYDIQTMRDIPLEYAEAVPLLLKDRYLYTINSYYDGHNGQIQLKKPI